MKVSRVSDKMSKGLTLPANIRALGLHITSLALSECFLSGYILNLASLSDVTVLLPVSLIRRNNAYNYMFMFMFAADEIPTSIG